MGFDIWKIAGHSQNDRQLKILRSATKEKQWFDGDRQSQ
jgi:hypothetical protein